jgi:hypothetical protein
MKRTFTFIASLLITVAMGAQTINIHKTDGSVVKYSSSEVEYIDFSDGEQGGEQTAYTTCPDANHPHMIDLGLPSGTKWACCNVGASTPEGYGNYYAWGETQPKSVYNEVTYSYFTGQDTDGDGWIEENFSVVNIGSDIAGTGYDAATVKWGAPWCMPSFTQIKEMLDNTTSTWTTRNGVNGRKFTGPNGGTIFLPAAGHRSGGELYDAGSFGYYWSSTLLEGDPSGAYGLDFLFGGAYWDADGYRSPGRSVRPVR